MGYTKNAISGFSWQTVLKLLTSLIAVIKIFFLARILSPEDFGLFSLTLIALGISESITQTGINLTIIQSKYSVKYFLDTAWVIAIIRGLLIAVLMLMLGIGMSRYFNAAELLWLISLASLVPFIKGFINPSIINLHKQLYFFKDSLYRFSLILVESLLAVVLAYVFKSVYVLSISLIGAALFEVIISFIFFKDKPRFNFMLSRAKTIFNNAKFLSIATIFNYLNENADDFLLGKIVGTYNLGLYHNAYRLGHKTNYDLSKSIHHGTIPIFTKIQHNLTRLKKAFKKSALVTLIISVMFSMPLIIFPKLTIKIILGEKWFAVVPLLIPLTLAGIIQSISNITYTLFLATKKYKIMNLHLFANVTLMFLLIIIMSQQSGLAGAVNAILISRLLCLPISIWGVNKIFKSS